MIKIYFAGPDVFRTNPQDYFDAIAQKCARYSVIPIFPFDSLLVKSDSIYINNIKLIEKAHAVVANIEPFRGPSVDPGVAFEIGYAKALQKPVIGYTKQPETIYKSRVTEEDINKSPEYPYVENFNLYDNLMIAHSCDFIHDTVDKALFSIKHYYKSILNDE